MNEPDASKIATIKAAVGPSPWYWQTFPKMTTESGITYEWTYHQYDPAAERQRSDAFLVTLAVSGRPERPILVLGSYCRPFVIGPDTLGLWYPFQGLLNVRCLRLPELDSFDLSDTAATFKKSRQHFFISGSVAAKAWIDAGLAAGRHELETPDVLAHLAETLMIADNPFMASEEDPVCSIFAVRWADRSVFVFPQYWMPLKKVDVGYVWVTRVARNPKNGRFVGDGIRMGSFELTDDGCHLERWLKETA